MPISPKIYHGNSTPRPDAELVALIDAHPKPTTISEYSYGTAGFRYEASLLPCVFVRMGIFAALRSASLGGVSIVTNMQLLLMYHCNCCVCKSEKLNLSTSIDIRKK